VKGKWVANYALAAAQHRSAPRGRWPQAEAWECPTDARSRPSTLSLVTLRADCRRRSGSIAARAEQLAVPETWR